MLISDKVDFKGKKNYEDTEENYVMRIQSHLKCVSTKHQKCKIYEVKTEN